MIITPSPFEEIMSTIENETIVDLADLVPPDKVVKFAGRTWTLPGDLPLVTYLQLNRMGQVEQEENVDEAEILNGMVSSLVALFMWNVTEDADATREFLRGELEKQGLEMLTQIIAKVYPADAEGEPEESPVEAEEANPPTSPDGETTTPS